MSSRRRIVSALLPFVTFALAACGDDGGSQQADTGLDAAPDAPDGAGDAGADAEPDVTPDAAPDSAPDAAPDVLDAAPDVEMDTTPDAEPDAAPDAPADAAPDADPDPVCGDGATEGEEQCDDGNDIDEDACDNDCLLPVCGDSAVEGEEECDAGPGGDALCDAECHLVECGDGVVAGDEECDEIGDGCVECLRAFGVRGAVTFQGRPLHLAPVRLEQVDGAAEHSMLTANDGTFRFDDLDAGTWRVVYAETPAWVLDGGPPGDEPDTVVLSEESSFPTVGVEVVSSVFPTRADAGEPDDPGAGVPGRVNPGGGWLARTLFPLLDVDSFVVTLEAGTRYELFTVGLSNRGDTYMQLFLDGEPGLLADGDDYLGGDSRIVYTPAVGGDYLVVVEGYPGDCQLASYYFGVAPLVDADGDNWSAVYDCDDTRSTVTPVAAELAGDGIDQNCDGVDARSPSVPDAIPANNRAAALEITASAFDPIGRLWHGDVAIRNQRTLASASEDDWLRYELAEHEVIELFMRPAVGSPVEVEVYRDDELDPFLTLNGLVRREMSLPGGTPGTIYFRFASSGPATYVPVVLSWGADADGDGVASATNPVDTDDGEPTVLSCAGPDEGKAVVGL